MFNQFWSNLSKSARIGFLAGVIFILLLTISFAIFIFRTDYQVLFSNLSPQDSSAMIAELEKMKIPYQLSADGGSILVDKNQVHKTRIKIMGKDIPLHGTVGLELFNNSDFGMTEFAQKVNYQRALQGEIARTILSLSEIESVRVHLVLPEETLFKKNQNKAKAAISLVLKQGVRLSQEQVNGIQRLVSSSVQAIQPQDVTVVDQRGIALTKSVQDDGGADVNSGRLDLKKETEQYLTKKADLILTKMFGEGEVITSVDVTLNMDRVKITTDDVIGVPSKTGQTQTGIVVRERENSQDTSAPLDAKIAEMAGRSSGSMNRETDYQVGHRAEQVISAPGAITRLHVIAVISRELSPKQMEEMRALLSSAVGASSERGDQIVIQGQAFYKNPRSHSAEASGDLISTRANILVNDSKVQFTVQEMIIVGLLLIACIIFISFLAMRILRSENRLKKLTDEEKVIVLQQIRAWLGLRESEQKKEKY